MAGKITIRRIGSVLPTVCLLLFLLCCVSTVWLSTVGFPSPVVRYVEKLASRQGITLRLNKLRLYPARGLAVRAEGVSIYADAEAEQPLATAESASFGVNASRLILGSVQPSFCMLREGRLLLPVTDPEGQQLVLDDLSLAARFNSKNMLHLTSGFVRIQGVPVRVQGSCDLSSLQSSEPADEKLNVPRLLAEHQETINAVYRHIAAQRWSQEQLPSLDVRLAIQDEFRIHLHGSVPSFDLAQFHFREAEVNLQLRKDAVTINHLSFRTVDPDASVRLQGGYDLAQRRLSFVMNSSAALMRMVRFASEGALREYLYKFRHPDDSPPRVSMSGDIVFEEDYTLQSARVRGNLVQKQLSIGSSKVDAAELSFFYDNGNFNIDKLELIFPEGSLQGVASACDGIGQAQLVADLPVQHVLALVHELGWQEAALPEGMSLGERVQLSAHARLTAPAFKPGQTHWQGFVPAFHMLAMEIKSGHAGYDRCRLQEPILRIQLGDVEQRKDLSLRSLGSGTLALKAQRAEVQLSAEERLELDEPEVSVELADVSCSADSLPHGLASVAAALSAKGGAVSGAEPLELKAVRAEATLRQVKLDPSDWCGSLSGVGLEAHVECAGAQRADAYVEQVELLAQNERGEQTALVELALASRLQATIAKLGKGEAQLGAAELHFVLPKQGVGSFSLQFDSEGAPCTLKAIPQFYEGKLLFINDIHGEFPKGVFAAATTLAGVKLEELELPARVGLSGSCAFSTDAFRFLSATFRVDAPELVRTPVKQAVFRGRRIPISLSAEALLINDEKEGVKYQVELDVRHETGEFHGYVLGSSDGRLRVTGENTIRPDVVDELIDSEDAHSIIRDFRFPQGGGARISGIKADIDYSNGLKVDSFCHVELYNTEYLISVIEDAPDNKERMRSDLGSNPYTLVSRAACDVLVKVRDERRDSHGAALPNESVVTINNALLVYSNSPWLRRQGWAVGVRETRLEGRSIIIDIEHSFVEINDVQGTVYPAYSLGMFYPELQVYLEDVLLPNPVKVESQQCVFPIYSDCVRPMSGVIRVISPEAAGFRFIGTTIPLSDFSGFICLSDDYVQLDRMNAKCWEGVLDAAVRIGISGKRTSFDGYAKAQCMNLQKIAAAYGSKQAPALCRGEIRFRSPSPELKDIKAYGRVDVEDGDLMTLSLFRPVSDLISDLPGHFLRLEKEVASASGAPAPKPGFFSRVINKIFKGLGNLTGKTTDGVGRIASNVPGLNHLIAYDLQEAHTNFDIINGFFITRDMKVKGYNLNVRLNLSINLDTLELRGNLWPHISSLPTILLSPFTFLSDFMVDIILYGDVGDVKWRIGLDHRKPNQPPSATSAPAPDSSRPKRAHR